MRLGFWRCVTYVLRDESYTTLLFFGFFQVHKAMLRIVPMGHGQEIIKMLRDMRGAAGAAGDDGQEDKLLRCDLDGRMRKDAPRAQ